LTFINICLAAKRYGVFMAQWRELRRLCTLVKPAFGLIGEPGNP